MTALQLEVLEEFAAAQGLVEQLSFDFMAERAERERLKRNEHSRNAYARIKLDPVKYRARLARPQRARPDYWRDHAKKTADAR